MTWRTTHRRWKRAVEAAMAPVWHLSERDRLAAEIANRILQLHGGGQAGSGLRSEGILLLLEAMVTRHLDEDVVRASLGLRYLETLADNVFRADYEDARLLADEARWVEAYLHRELHCPLLSVAGEDHRHEPPEQVHRRQDRLYAALVELAAAELREAGVAA